jgi:translation initiation factor 1
MNSLTDFRSKLIFVLILLMSENRTRLVYSTEQPILKKINPAQKDTKTTNVAVQQKVYVRLDRKSRAGKSVTLIEGLQMSPKDKESLLKNLKTRLGTGGTLKDGNLEIQGDHRDAIMTVLEELNCQPKLVGG